jgi:hypothetical protein
LRRYSKWKYLLLTATPKRGDGKKYGLGGVWVVQVETGIET